VVLSPFITARPWRLKALLGFVSDVLADRLLEPTLALALSVCLPVLAVFPLVPTFAFVVRDTALALAFGAELRPLRPAIALLPARLGVFDVLPAVARGLLLSLRVVLVFVAGEEPRLVMARGDFWPLDLAARFGPVLPRTLLAPAAVPDLRGAGDAFPVRTPVAIVRPEVAPLPVLGRLSLGILAMTVPHLKGYQPQSA
jgi:hypothetical protein